MNYYGVAPQTYTQIVKSGEKAKALAITPTRAEYTFNGWFMESAGNTVFNAATENITADTTVYAGWTKTKTGPSVYTFEAEQTSLKGKTVDTYVRDLKQDPTWANFGDNRVAGGDAYKEDGTDSLYYFVDYEESIYVGYRYYEARGVGNEAWTITQ